MKVLYIGNFVPEHSTENDVRRAFAALDWDVDTVQEQDYERRLDEGTWGLLLDRMLDADLVLHTMTQGSYPNPDDALRIWKACERGGVPTASIHLDLFYGLASPKGRGPQRSELPREHPMFRVAYVFTADGGHDAEWERDGVDHHWLPPGVRHDEAVDVTPLHWSESYPEPVAVLDQIASRAHQVGGFLVGFAGSDGYHPEWPHRPALVAKLREWYGDRFLHIGGSSTPRITGLHLNRVLASVPVWVGDSCLTRPDFPYWSDRIPETWGRGGFLVHPRVDALNGLYDATHPGTGWECGHWDELREEIDGWLQAASLREIRRGAFAQVTREHHTYVQRVQTMLDVMGLA